MAAPKQRTNLEELTRHAAAGLAVNTKDPDVQAGAMQYFYVDTVGNDPEDPVIGYNGSLYKDKAKFESVLKYFGHGKYLEALSKSTIGEIVANAEQFGYKAPDAVKKALAPYMGKTYTEIATVLAAGDEADKIIKEAGGENAFANRMAELAPLLQARKKAEEYQLVANALQQIEAVKLKGKVQSNVLEAIADYQLNKLAKAIK